MKHDGKEVTRIRVLDRNGAIIYIEEPRDVIYHYAAPAPTCGTAKLREMVDEYRTQVLREYETISTEHAAAISLFTALIDALDAQNHTESVVELESQLDLLKLDLRLVMRWVADMATSIQERVNTHQLICARLAEMEADDAE